MKFLRFQNNKDSVFFYLLFLILGYTATSVQILFLRTFLATCGGNEIYIGIFLSAWLFWTALGSYVLGKVVRRRKNPWPLVLILQTFSAFCIPATMLAIRFSRILLYPFPGEISGLGEIAIISIVLIAPFGFLSGGLFAAGSYLLHLKKEKQLAVSTSNVYMIETAGSAIGGIVFSLILLSIFNAFSIALFLLLLNILFNIYIAARMLKWPGLSLLYYLLFMFIYAFGALQADRLISEKEWPGFQIIAQEDSPYGRLTLIQRQENKTALENGIPLFTIPDRQTAEKAVHYGLLLHEKPEKVLLIGGGFSGAIPEILKHPSVKSLAYVEIDAALIRLGKNFLPQLWSTIKNDQRVKIFTTDGRLYLAQSKEKYDLIILNLPDPFTAQLNRFYTKEFYELVSRRLKPNGILTFRVSAAENYINQPLARYLKCLYSTLASVFKSVNMTPGEMVHFFAKNEAAGIKLQPELLIQRLKERRLQTQYVREYYIPFQISEQRMDYLSGILNDTKEIRINTDFAPSAYYLSSVFWSSRFSGFFPALLRRMQSVPFYALLLLLILGFLLIIVLQRRKKSMQERQKLYAGLSVLACGFTMISLELIIFLAYQALHGSLYHQLAILLGVFMAGMSAGTLISLRFSKKMRGGRLAGINLLLVLLAMMTAFFVHFDFGYSAMLSRIVLILLAFLAGMGGGFIFPVVSVFYYRQEKNQNSGVVYALDLVGSLIGAFFTATIIIPLFGFKGIFTLIILIHFFLATGIFLLRKSKNPK